MQLLAKYGNTLLAAIALAAIAAHLTLRFAVGSSAPAYNAPLWAVLIIGGGPLTLALLWKMIQRDFGADMLAGISIVTAALLGEYLAGAIVVLMLSGGQALEAFAVRSASSVLAALARRMPSVAHRRHNATMQDAPLADVRVGDTLIVFPHEACPVDGTVLEGRSTMDESYLTGEPYLISKTVGSAVLSGATNGESALTVRADILPIDSRYAKIVRVMRDSELRRPRMRRLGDQLGGWYTPLAVGIGLAAWLASGDPVRFLAVVVVATPCPLLIAIPVAILGSISLAARRGIIIRDPGVLERLPTCRTAIFDKTGTLTHGRPQLIEVLPFHDFTVNDALALAASLERYSKHPLSAPLQDAAEVRQLAPHDVEKLSEQPGQGLSGVVQGHAVLVTSRRKIPAELQAQAALLPAEAGGMECVILIDGHLAALCRFRDEPRREGSEFIEHLAPGHGFRHVLLVSGDRQSEVKYLAGKVGIHEVFAEQSPEQKLDIVRRETLAAPTVFVGDGINDAPALTAATVGVAFGRNSDVTSEASGVVVLDSSLEKLDELLHIARRLRRIALQSAVGGMALSGVGMLLAAAGYLPPVAGAIAQEVIDVIVVLNALRMAVPPRRLSDIA